MPHLHAGARIDGRSERLEVRDRNLGCWRIDSQETGWQADLFGQHDIDSVRQTTQK